jgi:hypothetical protein
VALAVRAIADILSTPTVVNERAFLTPFEGRWLVIGRQDIKK